ncbi:MAG: hypothetical protein KY453_07940 [Gemmatimonadetes bacterium]|nr:hypothetical protein [Gemmatimonadota bacterium]
MLETVYDVFARKNRGEPLHHIGYLHALDDEMARVYAWKTYDEENWFEMCVVPRAAIIPVNRDDGPFAAGRRAVGAGPEADDPEVPPGQPYGGDS